MKKRLRDIGEARIALQKPVEISAPAQGVAVCHSTAPWVAAGALAMLSAAAMLHWWHATRPGTPRTLMRFSVDLGPDAVAGLRTTAAISPDGKRLVYSVRGANGITQLATRLLDQSQATILSGTENAYDPFFSPDGQWIGFFALDRRLRKISVQGGAAVALCQTTYLRGASWGWDGNIIASLQDRLNRIPDAGGRSEEVVKPEDRGEAAHRWPQILPGGQTVLFTGHTSMANFDEANLEVLNLKTRQVKIVQRGGYFGRYLPSGHLVYIPPGNAVCGAVRRGQPGSERPACTRAGGRSGGPDDRSRAIRFLRGALRARHVSLPQRQRVGWLAGRMAG